MSDDRERLLEAHMQPYREDREEGKGRSVTEYSREHGFRAGYDAREPEVERLRAQTWNLGTARDEAVADLATARERVNELEKERERRYIQLRDSDANKRAEQAEARVRELEAAWALLSSLSR